MVGLKTVRLLWAGREFRGFVARVLLMYMAVGKTVSMVHWLWAVRDVVNWKIESLVMKVAVIQVVFMVW